MKKLMVVTSQGNRTSLVHFPEEGSPVGFEITGGFEFGAAPNEPHANIIALYAENDSALVNGCVLRGAFLCRHHYRRLNARADARVDA